jgi:2-dehydropantoate 2-reductase
MFVAAYREVLRSLRADGTPITPASNRLIEWMPEPLLVLALRFFLNTRLAVVGGERHAMAAPDEMKELADEIQVILDRTHTPSPASSALKHEIEGKLAAVTR